MSKKKYFAGLFLLMFLFFGIIMTGYYFFNVEVRGMKITNVGKIQDDYPQYMVNINDEFVDYMIEFEELVKEPQRVYSEDEITAISENLTKQNNLMIELQKNPPNVNNKDYLEIYKDYLKLYAFYIQGEVMRVEYVSAYKTEYTPEEIQSGLIANEETYILGVELCNMMGTMILENPIIVNKIHNTNAQSKHEVIPLDEWQEEVSKKLEEYEAGLENGNNGTITEEEKLSPEDNQEVIDETAVKTEIENTEKVENLGN